MSRQLDPEALDRDDVQYIAQRPNIHREFLLQGLGDPLDPNYPGLTFTPDEDEDDEEDSAPAESNQVEDPGYEEWKKKALQAEIDKRNEDREVEDEINPESSNNAALAYALRQDDLDSSGE